MAQTMAFCTVPHFCMNIQVMCSYLVFWIIASECLREQTTVERWLEVFLQLSWLFQNFLSDFLKLNEKNKFAKDTGFFVFFFFLFFLNKNMQDNIMPVGIKLCQLYIIICSSFIIKWDIMHVPRNLKVTFLPLLF